MYEGDQYFYFETVGRKTCFHRRHHHHLFPRKPQSFYLLHHFIPPIDWELTLGLAAMLSHR